VAEAFPSIAWAATAALVGAGSLLALVPGTVGLIILVCTRKLSPSGAAAVEPCSASLVGAQFHARVRDMPGELPATTSALRSSPGSASPTSAEAACHFSCDLVRIFDEQLSDRAERAILQREDRNRHRGDLQVDRQCLERPGLRIKREN
jgi:hypothetical protein